MYHPICLALEILSANLNQKIGVWAALAQSWAGSLTTTTNELFCIAGCTATQLHSPHANLSALSLAADAATRMVEAAYASAASAASSLSLSTRLGASPVFASVIQKHRTEAYSSHTTAFP